MKKRDFLTFADVSRAECRDLVAGAIAWKALGKKGVWPRALEGKALALVFEKSSTRTRVSFEMAMARLGGQAVYLNQDMSQLGRGETHADTARVLSRYADALVFRTFSHKLLANLATVSSVPVINGLTDDHHPCQILADLVTLNEKFGAIENLTVAYVGDANNMVHSWLEAAALLGFSLNIATPETCPVESRFAELAIGHSNINIGHDPRAAVRDVDGIYTDTWFSMGQTHSESKTTALKPFQLNATLLSQAKPNAVAMHCLPAHRGEEITDDVIDGSQSVVFDQAENRLYAQMALLSFLLLGHAGPQS